MFCEAPCKALDKDTGIYHAPGGELLPLLIDVNGHTPIQAFGQANP
jgi:hypothetical protein